MTDNLEDIRDSNQGRYQGGANDQGQSAKAYSVSWARKHIADAAYDADARWELIWSITARAIQDSLQRERALFARGGLQ